MQYEDGGPIPELESETLFARDITKYHWMPDSWDSDSEYILPLGFCVSDGERPHGQVPFPKNISPFLFLYINKNIYIHTVYDWSQALLAYSRDLQGMLQIGATVLGVRDIKALDPLGQMQWGNPGVTRDEMFEG
ncbi:hypothetical protein TNCT_85751 [Trichonephila clavata]|uniref:Uncharacterized protein n=1 Tax=Trichonephila clavata TaxID=2740835 RepID=A0A8X6G9W8_TRICU|nr:hypothetical protein TNCT_85751 [Trichonephila clavata]